MSLGKGRSRTDEPLPPCRVHRRIEQQHGQADVVHRLSRLGNRRIPQQPCGKFGQKPVRPVVAVQVIVFVSAVVQQRTGRQNAAALLPNDEIFIGKSRHISVQGRKVVLWQPAGVKSVQPRRAALFQRQPALSARGEQKRGIQPLLFKSRQGTVRLFKQTLHRRVVPQHGGVANVRFALRFFPKAAKRLRQNTQPLVILRQQLQSVQIRAAAHLSAQIHTVKGRCAHAHRPAGGRLLQQQHHRAVILLLKGAVRVIAAAELQIDGGIVTNVFKQSADVRTIGGRCPDDLKLSVSYQHIVTSTNRADHHQKASDDHAGQKHPALSPASRYRRTTRKLHRPAVGWYQ